MARLLPTVLSIPKVGTYCLDTRHSSGETDLRCLIQTTRMIPLDHASPAVGMAGIITRAASRIIGRQAAIPLGTTAWTDCRARGFGHQTPPPAGHPFTKPRRRVPVRDGPWGFHAASSRVRGYLPVPGLAARSRRPGARGPQHPRLSTIRTCRPICTVESGDTALRNHMAGPSASKQAYC